MIFKLFRITLFIIPFIFLSGFLPFAPLIGPGITIVTSGNVYKAGAQLMIDRTIKQKTGKNSIDLVKEEVANKNNRKNFDEEFKNLVKKRIQITRKKIVQQNNQKNSNQELKQLIEKRIKIVRKKLELNKINQ